MQGIDDHSVRFGALAVSYKEPEDVLKYLKTVKCADSRYSNDKPQDKLSFNSNISSKGKSEQIKKFSDALIVRKMGTEALNVQTPVINVPCVIK